MTEHAKRLMMAEEFYIWLQDQRDARYELIDGEPVLMAGANRRHDRIAVNVLAHFHNSLLGQSCQPFTADTYIRIQNGNRRLPDAGIECGNPDDSSLEAATPAFVMEILSPTTRTFDRHEKVEEYKTVASLQYILLVDPDYPQVRLYSRDDHGIWDSRRYEGFEAIISFPRIAPDLPTVVGRTSLSLILRDLYAGLEFRPRPALVDPNSPTKFGI